MTELRQKKRQANTILTGVIIYLKHYDKWCILPLALFQHEQNQMNNDFEVNMNITLQKRTKNISLVERSIHQIGSDPLLFRKQGQSVPSSRIVESLVVCENRLKGTLSYDDCEICGCKAKRPNWSRHLNTQNNIDKSKCE